MSDTNANTTVLLDLIQTIEDAATLVLANLAEPGDAALVRFIAEFDSYRDAADAVVRRDWSFEHVATDAQHIEMLDNIARWELRIPTLFEVNRQLDTIQRRGITVLTPTDAGYPAAFFNLGDNAPIALFVRGDEWMLTDTDTVSIVGARAATGYGEHVTQTIVNDLVQHGHGYTIVSGAAYGIDGMAHRATLAAGGRTIAVLAGGVDRPYPAGHENLIERIAQTGAVVSELPPFSPPTKWRFLQRNRLIAALGNGTVVVEAGARSGSLNTATHALALGRPVMAVPGPIASPGSAGTHNLIREGATLVVDAAQVIATIESE
jgi:DNA processing protein